MGKRRIIRISAASLNFLAKYSSNLVKWEEIGKQFEYSQKTKSESQNEKLCSCRKADLVEF